MEKIIRIATRKSQLALWQAQHIKDKLQQIHPQLSIELLPMHTSGDAFLKDKLQVIGGKGHFVKELEEALLDKRADLAVHSMKDVPATFPDGLGLHAICERANPLDAFVSPHDESVKQLPLGAIVGTASLRRQAQLLLLRPDLCIKTLRGNVQRRLEKLDAKECDAIILACAGLERLSLHARINQAMPADIMLPACGQGALGIECRNDDAQLHSLIKCLHHPLSATCIEVERQVNALMGGSCHAPIAVFCKPTSAHKISLTAQIYAADGKTAITACAQGDIKNSSLIAQECAQSLTGQGGLALIAQALHTP